MQVYDTLNGSASRFVSAMCYTGSNFEAWLDVGWQLGPFLCANVFHFSIGIFDEIMNLSFTGVKAPPVILL